MITKIWNKFIFKLNQTLCFCSKCKVINFWCNIVICCYTSTFLHLRPKFFHKLLLFLSRSIKQELSSGSVSGILQAKSQFLYSIKWEIWGKKEKWNRTYILFMISEDKMRTTSNVSSSTLTKWKLISDRKFDLK